MVGMGRTVSNGATSEFELTIVRESNGQLAYEAHPSGQPTATFPALVLADDSVVFEAREHDFQQRVGYRKLGTDSLLAWIEGAQRGRIVRIRFPYRRSTCP